MPEEKSEHTFKCGLLPRVLITMPVHMSSTNMRGIVSNFISPTQEVWQITAPPNSMFGAIARLLSILTLDAKEHIIQSNLMPSRPSAAVLLKTGEMRQGRGKKFAPWVLEEIDRLAEVFLSQHKNYIAEINNALDGSSELFHPFPEGFILRNHAGRGRLGPPPPLVKVDLSNSEQARGNLRQDQIIFEDYLRNRYMIHLKDDQLGDRMSDILANNLDVDSEGLVSINSEDPLTFYWLARFQEARTEKALRHGADMDTWPSGYIDKTRLPGSLQNKQLEKRQVLRAPTSLGQPFLVKYGERKYMEAAFHKGQILVSPASAYNDPSLNPALEDDELVVEIDFDPMQFDGYYPEQQKISDETRKLIRKKISSNYYVYCTASKLSTRLLLDFQCDIALVIRDPDLFLNRLDTAMKEKLPNWHSIVEHVEYYDPLQVTPWEVDVLTWKHFRFAYQKEVRVAWLPEEPIQALKPLLLELGSLSDISEIVLPTSATDLNDEEPQDTYSTK